MAAYHLNLWVDPEIRAGLEYHAESMGTSLSGAARVLLTQAMGIRQDLNAAGEPIDAAFAEAFQAASAIVRRRVNQVLKQVADEIARGELR